MADALWFWDDPGGDLEFFYAERRERLESGFIIETADEYWGGDYFLERF